MAGVWRSRGFGKIEKRRNRRDVTRGFLTPRKSLTGEIAVSFSWQETKNIVGNDAKPWTGAFADIVVNF